MLFLNILQISSECLRAIGEILIVTDESFDSPCE